MDPVTMLEAVQVLNGLMSLGVNGLITAQKIGAIIERSAATGQPISQDEWNAITADADVADARLAATIARLGGK